MLPGSSLLNVDEWFSMLQKREGLSRMLILEESRGKKRLNKRRENQINIAPTAEEKGPGGKGKGVVVGVERRRGEEKASAIGVIA